ncbi:hypothetical protein AAY473_028296 [Plecturocebus cupreus]
MSHRARPVRFTFTWSHYVVQARVQCLFTGTETVYLPKANATIPLLAAKLCRSFLHWLEEAEKFARNVTDVRENIRVQLQRPLSSGTHVQMYLSKRNGYTSPQKDLYDDVHSRLIHNIPQLETTQMSISKTGLTLLPRLECSGMITAHGSLSLLSSSDLATSAFQLAGSTGTHHHACLLFLEMGFHHVAQAGLKLLDLSDLPTLGSQSLIIFNMHITR